MGYPAGRIALLCPIVSVATFCITFPVAQYVDGTLHYPYYFLSNSIDYPIASNIGGLLLSIASIGYYLTVLVRRQEVRTLLTFELPGGVGGGGRKRCCATRALNNAATWCGLTAASGALGVCSFQRHVHRPVHLVFAAMFFLGGAVYLCLQLIISRRLGEWEVMAPGVRMLRSTSGVLACAAAPFFVFITPLNITFGADEDRVRFVISVFEAVCLLSQMGFLASFYPQWSHLELHLELRHAAQSQYVTLWPDRLS